METIYVAQLDKNVVIGVSQLKREGFVPATHLIEIDSFDTAIIGKIYDAKSGTFKEG